MRKNELNPTKDKKEVTIKPIRNNENFFNNKEEKEHWLLPKLSKSTTRSKILNQTTFALDLETCCKYKEDEQIVRNANETNLEIFKNNLELGNIKPVEQKTYAVMLQNCNTVDNKEQFMWCNTIEQYFDFMKLWFITSLDNKKPSNNFFINTTYKKDNSGKKIKINKTQKYKTLEVTTFIHNAKFDFSFFEPYLMENGFIYSKGETYLDTDDFGRAKRKYRNELNSKEFTVVQNDGIFYSAKINTGITWKTKVNNDDVEIELVINIIDFFKIISQSLDQIGKMFLPKGSEFLKKGETFDYISYRSENHTLEGEELLYCRNDVKILKEAIVQFFFKYGDEYTYTQSGIAMKQCINMTYDRADLTYAKKKEMFKNDYPNLSQLTKKNAICKASYKGGMTTYNFNLNQFNQRKTTEQKVIDTIGKVNLKKLKRNMFETDLIKYDKVNDILFETYKSQKIVNGIIGYGDINSSYPGTMKYKPLPLGLPKNVDFEPSFIRDNYSNELGAEDKLYLITIAFNGFEVKNKRSGFGFFQLGSAIRELEGIDNQIMRNSAEYPTTNIDEDGEFLGNNYDKCNVYDNIIKLTDKRFHLTLWNFELKQILDRFYLYDGDNQFENNSELGFQIVENTTLEFESRVGYFSKFIDENVELKNDGRRITEAEFKSYIEGLNENKGKYINGNETYKCKVIEGETIYFRHSPDIKLLAKINLNSVYGKFGSSVERNLLELELTDDEIVRYKKLEDEENMWEGQEYYLPFASACTAWSRHNLKTMIYKIEDAGKMVLYCDTDSVIFQLSDKMLKNPVKQVQDFLLETCGDIIHPTRLGAWGLEKVVSKFKVLGAKKYYMYGCKEPNTGDWDNWSTDEFISNSKYMCTASGLDAKCRESISKLGEEGFERFELGAEFLTKRSFKTKGGIQIANMLYKINESSYGR